MAIDWIDVDRVSLRQAARDHGHDLAYYEDYPVNVKNTVKSRAINAVLSKLDVEWERQIRNINKTSLKKNLRDVKSGVYVICLTNKMCVRYKKGCSRVIYIGKGQIRNRLYTHFHNKLFKFSQSLNDIDFRFFMSEPKRKNASYYYEDVEADLLNAFLDKYGGDDDSSQRYPFLNHNAGRTHDHEYQHGNAWDKPLKNTRQQYRWILEPTSHLDIGKMRDPSHE